MSPGHKSRLLDLGFVSALLLTSAIPLIVLRETPVLGQAGYLVGLLAIPAVTCLLWLVLARRSCHDAPPSTRVEIEGASRWWETALIAALLGGVVFLSFYGPLQLHFWGGWDEYNNFENHANPWSDYWDRAINRPLTYLSSTAGQMLSPGRIEGFLWLAAFLCWGNALLLFAILRELLPQARVLPAAAAVLLIVNRADASCFYVLWTTNIYWTSLLLLLLALWLFLASNRRGSRGLLTLACLALAAALLSNEGTYPLATLGPVLAWLVGRHRHRLLVWAYAWTGTVALFALRFVLFLHNRGTQSYQAGQSATVYRDPATLLANVRLQLGTLLNYFQTSGALALHWRTAAVVLGLASLAVGLAAWRSGSRPGWRPCMLGLGLAALAVLLGTVPFLHLPTTFRTQFLAAPGQAVLLACSLGLSASLLGRRGGAVFMAACVGLASANVTGESLRSQKQLQDSDPVRFERTVNVFRQMHALSPTLAPDTLVVLVLEDPNSFRLGVNYGCIKLGRCLLGAPVVQANAGDQTVKLVFKRQTVTIEHPCDGSLWEGEVGYDHLIAFRVAADSTVSLLRRLPASLLPPENAAAAYRPLERMSPGPVTDLPYLRYPRWLHPPRDLFDMADGVLLGDGWGPPECRAGEVCRRAWDGAELAVNPLGQRHRALRLEVEVGQAGRLEALDQKGKTVAAADLGDRREICLSLPTDPDRVHLFRLRGGTATGEPIRVFCPGGKVVHPSELLNVARDVATGGLKLGANWYGPETYGGETWRWVNNNAEVVLGLCAEPGKGRVLHLTLEPGPGQGGQPARLQVLDQGGRVLAAERVTGKQDVRVPLPPDAGAGAVYRLHVEDAGRPTATDPRVLNFRVFHCDWAPSAAEQP